MASDLWIRTKAVLAAALEQPPNRRAAILDDACQGDPALRAEVESLLRAHDAAGTFIDKPAPYALDVDPRAVLTAETEEQDPRVGRPLGPYFIEACIGRGGMGAVYLARRDDREFERRVAIKMIRRGMDSALVIRRFRHERQILASFDHPHIAALFDGGTTPDGLPYFVMEHVDGVRIDRYAAEHRLTTADRVRLCLGVLDAVQHAHDHHIVHRDIKPSNVLVTADGQPKLLDFGIAKILEPGLDGSSTFSSLRPMTPEYAAPEQVRGHPVTPATDVYALGVLLYELLTGRRPYRAETGTAEEMARLVCEQEPEPPSAIGPHSELEPAAPGTALDSTLDEIVLKALRKEPNERYQTVAALADDLRRFVAGQRVSTAWDARRYRAVRLVRRHRTALGAAAIVVITIATTAVIATRLTVRRGVDSPAVVAASTARPSLAVVSFRNLSQRQSDAWMSTAIAEMLTTELAGDGQLRMLPAERVARAERDLGVTAGGGIDAAGVARLRAALASEYVVTGALAVSDGPAPRAMRIDVRIHRAAGDPIAVAGSGDEARLFAMIAEVSGALRSQLQLKPSTPEATIGARAAFPRSVDATRLYAEGAARLRLLDAVAARDLLERAESLEPDNPLIQTALASAWTALGYDARATGAAQKAFDASSGLNREDRLNVEGRLYEAQRKWQSAVDVYRTLWGFFADNAEYGLRLVSAQIAAGRGRDALATIADVRRLPEPQNQDPRIDLAEVQAFAALGDFKREGAAIERAVDGANRSGSRLLVARARLFEGRNRFNQGQIHEAVESFEKARELFTAAGDNAGAAIALNSLATTLGDMQDISRAEQMFQQALATSEAIGDKRTMASVFNNYGILLKDQRRFAEARRAHERSLAIKRQIGDINNTAVSLSNIGVVLFEQDRLAEASTYYKQSLAVAREVGDKRGQIRALHNLAIVDRQMGHLGAARRSYEESLAMRTEIGDKRGGIAGRVELGIVMLAQAEIEAARRTEEEAMALAREVGMKPGEAQALFQLGETAAAAGDSEGARRYHEQALAIRQEMKETRTVVESQMALAELALQEGRPAEAESEARRIADSVGAGDAAGPVSTSAAVLTARCRLAASDVDGAERALAEARRLAADTENVDLRRSLVMVEVEIDAARGALDRAHDRLTTLRASLARSGMVLAELEARLLLLRLDREGGRPTVRADAVLLARDARAKGAGAIARRLRMLQGT